MLKYADCWADTTWGESCTFLTLETIVSVEIQPMVAHFEEGSERNLQKEEISLMNLDTQNFPHLYNENGSLWK
jgi:CMP-N-acetylneuraminic acid synthetase